MKELEDGILYMCNDSCMSFLIPVITEFQLESNWGEPGKNNYPVLSKLQLLI